ncbi:MAG: SprT family zinc-dependent metalloprotease [Solidesulfovibrio sp.]|uniref:M48 family metallopeptidase n=1 Tax=Solidesulfovibrio sp. TaxID=2910990 RepID=UPI002B1F946E|nr:SprT family zinc-dependent metalloprotease [Solidesulfovibrio sp.]MEA4856243.1 SprT family zinc-dependent metalloprotease [Solidesulfovibrio sp.]
MRARKAIDVKETARLIALGLPPALPVSVRVSARARGIVLRMLPGSGLEVVSPAGVAPAFLLQAVESRRDWIARVFGRLCAEGGFSGRAAEVPRPGRLVLTAFSREWELRYLAKDRPGCAVTARGPGALVVSGAVEDASAVASALGGFCRLRAGELLRPALAAVSRDTGLPYSALTIRAQRTRWGSCTAKGRVSLNYTIAFLPWELCRLVMIHELCHTVELNHSPRFWNVVERFVPGCRELDARLNSARHYLPLWLDVGLRAVRP